MPSALRADKLEFRGRNAGMLLRSAVQQPPGDQPEESEAACENEGWPPGSEPAINRQNDKGRHGAANSGAAVEHRHCPGALFRREPLRHGFGGSRPITGFTGTEEKSKKTEAADAAREGRQTRHRRIEGDTD